MQIPIDFALSIFWGLRASGLFFPRPIPQTRSVGLASTSTLSPVERRKLLSALFCRNFLVFPFLTMCSFSLFQTALSKFLHFSSQGFALPRVRGAENFRSDFLIPEQFGFFRHHVLFGGGICHTIHLKLAGIPLTQTGFCNCFCDPVPIKQQQFRPVFSKFQKVTHVPGARRRP